MVGVDARTQRSHRAMARFPARLPARSQPRVTAVRTYRHSAPQRPSARRRDRGPSHAPPNPTLRAAGAAASHSRVGCGELDDRGRGWYTVRGKSGLHWARCQVTPGRPGHSGRRTGQQRTDRPPEHRWVRVKRWGKSPPRGRQRTVARQPPAGARPSKRREAPTSIKTPRVGCYRSRVTGSAEE